MLTVVNGANVSKSAVMLLRGVGSGGRKYTYLGIDFQYKLLGHGMRI